MPPLLGSLGNDSSRSWGFYQIISSSGGGSLVWAATADYPVAACYQYGMGTSATAAFFCGGAAGLGQIGIANSYSFNGTAFTAGPSMGTGKGNGPGGGTATSGIAGPGLTSAGTGATQTYNGTAFTSVTACPVAYQSCSGSATSSSNFIAWSGITAGYNANSYVWNGTSWAAGGTPVSTRRYFGGAGGGPSDAMAVGGNNAGGYVQAPEKYNGSAWSTLTSMPTTYNLLSGSGASSTAYITCGGCLASTPPAGYAINWNASQKWNGTAWSAGPSPRTALFAPASSVGSNTSAIMAGGLPNAGAGGSQVAGSGEILLLSSSVTSGVFGGAPNPLITRQQTAGFGNVDAGVIATGIVSATSAASTTSELSNGVTWATTNNPGTSTVYSSGVGSSTSGGLLYGQSGGTATAIFQTYNGSTWSTGTSNSVLRFRAGGFGTSTSACGSVAGYDSGSAVTTAAYLYNGSAWSAAGSISSGNSNNTASGTTTAAISSCGANSAGTQQAWAWTFNGTTWTSISASATTRLMPVVFGDSSLALTMNGGTPGVSQTTTYAADKWNGSAWSTTGSPITSRATQPQGANYGKTGISGGFTANGSTGTTNVYANYSETYYP